MKHSPYKSFASPAVVTPRRKTFRAFLIASVTTVALFALTLTLSLVYMQITVSDGMLVLTTHVESDMEFGAVTHVYYTSIEIAIVVIGLFLIVLLGFVNILVFGFRR